MSGKNTPYINFWNLHSNYSKSDKFARKKSIIIQAHIWHQKLPFIIFVANRNFIFINISIKLPFRAKTLVPYESQKREKIHISYIVHPRNISLTESRGSSSFFYSKKWCPFFILSLFEFRLFTTANFEWIFPPRGEVYNFDDTCFWYTFGPSLMPPIHFWCYS